MRGELFLLILLIMPFGFSDFIDSGDPRFKLPDNQVPVFTDVSDSRNILQRLDQNFNLKVQDYLDPRVRQFNFLNSDVNTSSGGVSGISWDSLNVVIPWADVNVSDSITVNGYVRDSVFNSSVPWADANVANALILTDINYVSGNAIKILDTGKVGIGLTNPTYKLDVYGTDANGGLNLWTGLNFKTVPEPLTLTGTAVAGSDLNIGIYTYKVSFYTALGETDFQSLAGLTVTTTAGNRNVNIGLPISSDPRVIGRKLYRTKVNGSFQVEYLLATIANNTDTNYLDAVPDSSLTGATSYVRADTTNQFITVDQTQSMIISSRQTAFGFGALDSITSGFFNVGYGYNAATKATTAAYNTALGQESLNELISGQRNVAVGLSAGYDVNTGTSNVVMGAEALRFVRTGTDNIAIGDSAGRATTTAVGNTSYNTVVGSNAMYNHATGNNNTVVGALANYGGTATNNSVFLGYQAGRNNLGGGYNIVVGANVKLPDDNRTGGLDIGNVLYGTGLHQSTSLTHNPAINGKIGIKNVDPTVTFDVNGGALFRNDVNVLGTVTIDGNVGIGSTWATYPLHIDKNVSGISIYADGNISANGYITHTETFDKARGKALSFINDADEYKTLGKVDDEKFVYSKVQYEKKIVTGMKKIEFPPECKTVLDILGEEVYECITPDPVYEPTYETITETGVSVEKEIALLKQALYEIKSCVKAGKDYNSLKKCLES